jgi:hypothetical protein
MMLFYGNGSGFLVDVKDVKNNLPSRIGIVKVGVSG